VVCGVGTIKTKLEEESMVEWIGACATHPG